MRWIDAARARLALLFRRRAAESRMDEEFRFHLDMEAERLVREEGLDPVEARRRAHVAFGGVERHKEELRDGRGLAWLGGLTLDLKLGGRMLVKYPGLTLVGGLAMAFGIWAGAIAFVMMGNLLHPTLPLPQGERVVQIHSWDASANEVEQRKLGDFLVWRGGLRSVTDLGAYRDVSLNLVVGRDVDPPLRAAEVTASAFRIAPEPPLLGRALVPADERPGAPPVVVIGHDVWRKRFAGDPGVVGRTVQLGGAYATVVGVMPEGFAFPVSHEVWTPLRPDALAPAPREGPEVSVFGRLAPGATLKGAQAELAAFGRRAAAASPQTHRHLQPHVTPYTEFFPQNQSDLQAFLSINLVAVTLLVLICSNVALLLFARAASREGELVVRSALGASRGRIVAQLFAEALVLGAVAAAVGLAAAQLALRQWGIDFLELNLGPLPFWYDVSLSPRAVLYAGGLTLLGAGIAGVVPARKITRGLGSSLKQGTAGSGVRFGGVWTAVIVTQVAFTVAFPLTLFFEQQEAVRLRSLDMGFAAGEYLGMQLTTDAADSAAHAARLAPALERLRQRIAAEPGVRGVTFADRLPRNSFSQRRIEVDAPAGGAGATVIASTASIDPSYFDVMEAPVLAGRAFTHADLAPNTRVAIVDQGFVDLYLQGRSPIGRQVRFVGGKPGDETGGTPAQPWYEIVGMVKELGMGHAVQSERIGGMYLPAVPGSAGPANMIVHAEGDPLSLAPRVREIAAAVDPTLRIVEVQRLDQVTDSLLWVLAMWLRITFGLTAVAILLSLAGIYAVLSFTVARRTREIGVRVALGAPRARVVAAIFRRPLTQVGAGIAAGYVLVTLAAIIFMGHRPDTALKLDPGVLSPGQYALLVAYAALMLGVCMLACVVPTRRALRVQPVEALRAE
ncbi:MAG TPA: ABC transporter permease [Longimicrobium sp.]|jgi:predicted permease